MVPATSQSTTRPPRQLVFLRRFASTDEDKGKIMSLLNRALGAGTLAAGIMAATVTGAAHAAPLDTTAAGSSVQTAAMCGYLDEGIGEHPLYVNCSPFSVEVRIEHWWEDDTYQCVRAHFTEPLGNDNDYWDIYNATFDGVTNC